MGVIHFCFWDLITGNDNKLSLSKVQMLLWTMLYLSYSTVFMVKTGQPPELNPSAYILMGISGATYVGTKVVRAVENVAIETARTRPGSPKA